MCTLYNMEIDDVNTVNAKGSVVIPSKLRKKYNIKPGDQVVWIENEKKELVLKRFKSAKIDYEEL